MCIRLFKRRLNYFGSSFVSDSWQLCLHTSEKYGCLIQIFNWTFVTNLSCLLIMIFAKSKALRENLWRSYTLNEARCELPSGKISWQLVKVRPLLKEGRNKLVDSTVNIMSLIKEHYTQKMFYKFIYLSFIFYALHLRIWQCRISKRSYFLCFYI
jgi:hypothetical protein